MNKETNTTQVNTILDTAFEGHQVHPPQSRKMKPSPQLQMIMDYRLPMGVDHVTPKELAAASGYTSQHIIHCYEEGKIMGFQSNGRSKRGSEARKAIRIPREHAILWLCSVCNFDEEMVFQEILDIARRKLPRELRRELVHRLGATL
jgi:hypothetical protein